MSHAIDSKQAAAILLDPLNAPEPSAETGPGASFRSTFAPAPASGSSSPVTNNPHRDSLSAKPVASTHSRNVSSSSNKGPSSHVRNISTSSNRSARSGGRPETFPEYRAEAFGEFEPSSRRSTSGTRPPPSAYPDGRDGKSRHRRRTSSLNKRYPGDESDEPLKILRRDSRKAYRSPHLSKRQLPGADMIDRLDPAVGGVPYHHEGPFDAALLSRNSNPKNAPLAALESTNAEALKATPKENVKDAVERHRPLDGVAMVAPGQPDQFGRTYDYEEGADLMHEDGPDGPGYKRWAGKDYSPDDLKGKGEPAFSLDRAMKAHKISDSGIEMTEGSALMKDYHNQKRDGTLDSRDPVHIAGDDAKYAELQYANDADVGRGRSGSLREGLKKRFGSLKHKKKSSVDE